MVIRGPLQRQLRVLSDDRQAARHNQWKLIAAGTPLRLARVSRRSANSGQSLSSALPAPSPRYSNVRNILFRAGPRLRARPALMPSQARSGSASCRNTLRALPVSSRAQAAVETAPGVNHPEGLRPTSTAGRPRLGCGAAPGRQQHRLPYSISILVVLLHGDRDCGCSGPRWRLVPRPWLGGTLRTSLCASDPSRRAQSGRILQGQARTLPGAEVT